MAHHKRRKRKGYVGCCGMCACKRFDMGVPNKRKPSMQELRAPKVGDWQADSAPAKP